MTKPFSLAYKQRMVERMTGKAAVSATRLSKDTLSRWLREARSLPVMPPEDARAWVARFVEWYNGEHLHSAIRFVTPDQRHFGLESDILTRRAAVYERARRRHPERWSRSTRDWTPIGLVVLNPETEKREAV